MSGAVVSVALLAAFLLVACLLAVRAGRGQDKTDLAQWSVGGRSLGIVMTLVLMAGETYTSFSYLGAAGWSYSYGASGLYLVAYLSIGMAASYVIGPLLWHYAHRHRLHNISDLVAHRFAAPCWARWSRWSPRCSCCPTSSCRSPAWAPWWPASATG